MAKLNDLSVKQEAFARAFVETGNASEAYRLAGYSKRQSAQSIHENASKLLAKVLPRVEALRAEHAKRHDVSIDSITEMLRADRELARSLDQPSAAVSATMGLAKLHGLIVDKAKTDVNLSFGAAFEEYVRGASWAKGPT